jgi:crossover junction endodeoxyribonuclease RuvC
MSHKPNPARNGAAGSGNSLLASDDAPENQANLNGVQPPSICNLGIDPGISGAIAFYFPAEPGRIIAEDPPVAAGNVDAATLAARINQLAATFAILERVASRPGQGVASPFKFGMSYGAIAGLLAALEIPVHLVTPSVWKQHFRLGQDKEQSRALALRLFPACATHFARKKDHNRAEAALLALYGANLRAGGAK